MPREPEPGKPTTRPYSDDEKAQRGGWIVSCTCELGIEHGRIVKRAIGLSSNRHPAGFDEFMPKTIAKATVDRLSHRARLVVTESDSVRLTQATDGKPLTTT